MRASVEVHCIVCQQIFCCAECRWRHEQNAHGLLYDCPICRGHRFLCKPEELNQAFVKHLTEEHLPLHCKKCNKTFDKMEDLFNIDKCTSISELLSKEQISNGVDDKFNSLYEKFVKSDSADTEENAMKSSKTAVITPMVRKQNIVEYDSSDAEDENKTPDIRTPYPLSVPKTPKLKKQRAATPHVKKLLSMMRQKGVEEYEEMVGEEDFGSSPCSKITPLRNECDSVTEIQNEITTPTSHINVIKLAQIVTTSTPTHPTAGWTMFPEQGADSPLSEIETTENLAQSIGIEPSKTDDNLPIKLKSIIVTGSKIRLGSQDSSEKHVTFQDSDNNTEASSIKKKVKFADDTIFEQEPKIKRVYRKPKRMLTPGPQRPRFCYNPRFQALINRFENQGITMARTPVNSREKSQESTPPITDHANIPARAIIFKEDSPVVELDNYSKDSNDLFKTCIGSPEVSINNALTALSANIAGSVQNCLSSALRATDEATEIEFKFTITKKKVSVRRIVEDENGVDDKLTTVERDKDSNKVNIWSSVARAVKNVFWGDRSDNYTSTSYKTPDSIDSSSSASKRKIEDTSDNDLSPVNHKRHKYNGRIRCRPPLRSSRRGVTSLRSSQSAEQQMMVKAVAHDDGMNQSF